MKSKLIHYLLGSICMLLSLPPAFAGDPDYSAAKIPEKLKKNAHVVKRMEEVEVKIYNPGEVKLTKHYVITILDAKGESDARLVEYYDKLMEIRSIKGALYDAAGNQVKKLKQSDIQDLSAVDDASLMTDARIKRHQFYETLYPHTVEYEVEMKINHTFYLPNWIPQEGEEFAVEQSRLVVNTPDDYTLRHRSYNYKGEPLVVTEKGTRTYTWEIKDLEALPDEEYAPEWDKRSVMVRLAPASFEMQRYKGTMNTWEEYGNFIYALNKGKDELPDNIKQTVHQLTDGLSREQKIDKLYRYLQEHTRYISIQLGIGGWQTFDAAYVASKGYGDCKALSNYMCAMLKEAGVKASCVLVRAGDGLSMRDEAFPSTQFNHVIVCAPGEKDTTWLECTSSYLPAGYLSGFTANRAVLMLNEKGSKLLHTPTLTIEQNLQVRQIDAKVTEGGDVIMKASTYYTGLQQDDLRQMLHSLTKEKMLDVMKQGLQLSSYDVNGFGCKETSGGIPGINEQLEINAHNYASMTGKRMFLAPNLLNKTASRIDPVEQRRADISLVFPYRDIDTVRINVPEGYVPESLPAPVTLNSPFGAYTAKVSMEGNILTYIRAVERKGGTYPAAQFPELETFMNAIYKADRAKVVLVKK
ncbi:DUF3857 domain-containing transglutaminase family protein [Chitinophaga tropicalis]|uniref:DUF3857 domain-containing protein n=1 Tax=Chitinophaga tropicalis TaxID=2683588 RepID=A0A7K1UB94_9BACT|nr:DUF3857 domain-containing protein [Chitinophaga tropicalis]MVT11265.1 DUF3857 domain-containing protein [Chitinophaga tropicalis]